jgi:hypothetical protein
VWVLLLQLGSYSLLLGSIKNGLFVSIWKGLIAQAGQIRIYGAIGKTSDCCLVKVIGYSDSPEFFFKVRTFSSSYPVVDTDVLPSLSRLFIITSNRPRDNNFPCVWNPRKLTSFVFVKTEALSPLHRPVPQHKTEVEHSILHVHHFA